MSEHEFEVGDEVAFYGGQGAVVDVERYNQNTSVKILTSSGETRVIANNVASLTPI